MTATVSNLWCAELAGFRSRSGGQPGQLPADTSMITGQKIDFNDHSGITGGTAPIGKEAPLAGFPVAQVDGNRVR